MCVFALPAIKQQRPLRAFVDRFTRLVVANAARALASSSLGRAGGTFVGGGGGSGLPISSFGNIPVGEVSRNWGAEWKKAALKYHDRIGGSARFEAEHLPYKQNYLDLDPTYTDKWGDPLLRTTIDWTDHEMRMRAFATKIADQMAKEIAGISGGRLVQTVGRGDGRRSGRYQTAAYATTHLHGGAIMSDTPADGVVSVDPLEAT